MEQMRRYPGCIYGWAPLFERLAREFSDLPSSCSHTLILENIHQLDEAQSTLKLVVFHFLAQLPVSATCVLISNTPFPAGMILGNARRIGVRDLQVQAEDDLPSVSDRISQLPRHAIHRLIHLSQGRAEVLTGVLIACEQIGDRPMQKILQQAEDLDHLLAHLGRSCLQIATPGALHTLAFALTLGYFEAETFKEIVKGPALPEGPWLQSLTGGWVRIREVWQPALKNILSHYLDAQSSTLVRAAGLLDEMGAIEIAVPIYLQFREYEQAAKVIQAHIESLMNLGQWETVNGWLRQLPGDVISGSPKLLYARGELQAFYGFPGDARRSFELAGRAFSAIADHSNACRSLLADSALAFRDGDEQRALLSAQNAYVLSSGMSVGQEQAWASWQLGMLASHAGKTAYARARFEDACQWTNDPYTRELFQRAWTYAQQMESAGLQQEDHQRQAELAEQTRLEMSRRLQALFKLPPETLPDLLKAYGWLAVPLSLKLPAHTSGETVSPFNALDQLVHLLKIDARVTWPWRRVSSLMTSLSPLDLLAPIRPMLPEEKGSAAGMARSMEAPASKGHPLARDPSSDAKIMIYCLGPLRVLNDRQFVTSWPSHKAQHIFKYLLLHRNTLVHKETIMEAFWPDAEVDAARRNLHQAIYNLRLTLKDVDDGLQLIEFEQDGYRLNPAVPLWIDYPVFEQHYTVAQQKELAGFNDQAMVEYAVAEEMYIDHLFSEDLYEDWLRSQREYLWQVYLSAATRLAEYHVQEKNFSAAISIGQRILQKDPCEETAHQILMRCFHSQGQRQLAIRQYEVCRQALRDGLDADPSATTRQFFSEILNA